MPYPEDTHSTLGKWLKEQQDKVDKAKAMHQRVRERQRNKKNKTKSTTCRGCFRLFLVGSLSYFCPCLIGEPQQNEQIKYAKIRKRRETKIQVNVDLKHLPGFGSW